MANEDHASERKVVLHSALASPKKSVEKCIPSHPQLHMRHWGTQAGTQARTNRVTEKQGRR